MTETVVTPADTAIHPKVAIPAFVGSVVATMLWVAKTRWNVDLGGIEGNLIVIISAVVGYYTNGG